MLEKIVKAEKINPKTQSIDSKKAIAEISAGVQSVYCDSLCECPRFPEKLIQYGFKCFKTQFCVDDKNVLPSVQYGNMNLKCPCC